MTEQSECTRCGTITEPVGGQCPVCGEPVHAHVGVASGADGTPAPAIAPADPDRPAPRPDPYTQFGNPLHDTWGAEPEPRTGAGSQVTSTQTTKRRRPAVRRAAWFAAIVALAGAAWLGRSWLGDRWDSLYDTVEDWTGGEEATGVRGHDDTPADAAGEVPG